MKTWDKFKWRVLVIWDERWGWIVFLLCCILAFALFGDVGPFLMNL